VKRRFSRLSKGTEKCDGKHVDQQQLMHQFNQFERAEVGLFSEELREVAREEEWDLNPGPVTLIDATPDRNE